MEHSKGTPGYARPTRASIGRQKKIQTVIESCVSRTSSQAHIPNAGSAGYETTTAIVRWETYRKFSASTVASRNRGGKQRPFRCTALPAEFRNKIYEYLDIDDPRHYVCLYNRTFADLETLPRLLHVNKQLCNEAGGYYLNTTRRFDILVDGNHLESLRQWLQIIAPANRDRLAANSNVCIRIVQPRNRAEPHCQYDRNPYMTMRRMHFARAAYSLG